MFATVCLTTCQFLIACAVCSFAISFHVYAFTPMHSRPCIHAHAFMPMHSRPCIHAHAFMLMHSRPCIHAHAFTPMHSRPCIHAHAFTPMHSRPCIHADAFTRTHLYSCICTQLEAVYKSCHALQHTVPAPQLPLLSYKVLLKYICLMTNKSSTRHWSSPTSVYVACSHPPGRYPSHRQQTATLNCSQIGIQ